MTINELQRYKKILILGYGVEGRATHIFLKKHCPQADIIIGDKKYNPEYLLLQREADLAIRTPLLNKDQINIAYTTATNIFFANTKGMVIGITGTKGKSTTTALIHHVLKKSGRCVNLGGNIGVPLLSLLNKEDCKCSMYVIELSSYQLDDIEYSPHISVMLNIYPEHLDYHGSFENYQKAKRSIVRFAKRNDYLIYNPAFAELLAIDTKANKIPFLPVDESENIYPLLGRHNRENIGASRTVCELLGVGRDLFTEGLASFTSLEHRMQSVGTFRGIIFINDASSSNPKSTVEALKTYKNVGTIFLGGLDRGYDFSELVSTVNKSRVKNIVLFPNSDIKLAPLLKQKKYKVFMTSSMKKAVAFAFKNTQIGMICLLSTGAPSYGVFDNFKDKGNQFIKNIKEYEKKVEKK